MSQFITVVKLITQILIALPWFEKIIRMIIDAINEVIIEKKQKELEKDLSDAADKAIKNKDTSDLEKLMGKK
jgi:hypothetical protein